MNGGILNWLLIFKKLILSFDLRIHFIFEIISSNFFIPFNPLLYDEFLIMQLLKHFFFERIISHKISRIIYFSTLNNEYFQFRPVIDINWSFSNLSNNLHSFYYLAKHNILTIQVRTSFQSYEKLTVVRISTSVSHRK